MEWLNVVVQGVLLGGLFALLACGLSLLFGTMRVINLAHGDLAVVAAYLAVGLVPALGIPQLYAFVIVVPIFAAIGYLGQRSLIQTSLERGPLTVLLVSFGLSIVIQNALLEFLSADSRSIDLGTLKSRSFHLTSEISVAYLSLGIFVVAVSVLLGLQYFLSRSATGRMIRAVADDREASQITGIDYRHVFGIAAAIALSTVALAGLAFGAYSTFDPSIGPSRLLFAFETVVIGGLGSLWGTLVGGIVLGVAQTIGAHIDPAYGVLSGHLVFFVVLAIRPQGIARGRED
jgi:branched-chain amino acid transport system permease protein